MIAMRKRWAISLILLGVPASADDYYGTLEPFVANAVYFVLTDRFVDGDPGNNQVEQGGQWHTFDRPLRHDGSSEANIGYLGGDFQGVLDGADDIKEMGFDAIWITPIVDNPDEAFSGGDKVGQALFADHGKTGYHGYWGVNFYQVDEHLESANLSFQQFAQALETKQLKLVLDIVANHGSPAFTMSAPQDRFGEIYDQKGVLVADHQNLHPTTLDRENPLHQFYHHEPDLAQLSNLDETNPAVVDYLVNAYLQWIEQGADAFRVDTIRHMPHSFWKEFSSRIRAKHPDFFMFAESFDYAAEKIAPHTYPENGGVSVLDFPGKQAMEKVFTQPGGDFAELPAYLHLSDGMYHNPYELAIFYDNHDMPRVSASDAQYQDLHNWLFTSRGFPVVYYGSETGFMSGAAEHYGNRNFYGVERVIASRNHPVRLALETVAAARRSSIALQRGLQFNIEFSGDTASFMRVYSYEDVEETVLVVLNKGEIKQAVKVDNYLIPGHWQDMLGTGALETNGGSMATSVDVPAHGVRLFRLQGVPDHPRIMAALGEQMGALQQCCETEKGADG